MFIDHLVISGETLEEAVDYVESALDIRMQEGGRHELFGTHNKLLALDNGLYLECIAVDPNAIKPKHPRWFNLDHFFGKPRLSNWVCSSEELKIDLAKMQVLLGQVIEVSRGDYSWSITVPENGILPFDGCFPALIKWPSIQKHPLVKLPPSGLSLDSLTIYHPDASKLQELLRSLSDERVSFRVRSYSGFSAHFSNSLGQETVLET